MTAFRQLDAMQSTFQRHLGTQVIDIRSFVLKPLLGSFHSGFGPIDINILASFSGFRQDRHSVRQRFGKSAADE